MEMTRHLPLTLILTMIALSALMLLTGATAGDMGMEVTPSGAVSRSMDPTGLSGDTDLSYTVKITNNGLADENVTISFANVHHYVEPTVNGNATASGTVSGGTSWTVTVKVMNASYFDPYDGAFDIVATNDTHAVSESVSVVLLKGQVDIPEVVQKPNVAYSGDDVEVIATVVNVGTARLEGVVVTFTADQVEVKTMTIDLDVNESVKVRYTWKDISLEEHHVGVKVRGWDSDIGADEGQTIFVFKDNYKDNPTGPGFAGMAFLLVAGLLMAVIGRRERS